MCECNVETESALHYLKCDKHIIARQQMEAESRRLRTILSPQSLVTDKSLYIDFKEFIMYYINNFKTL
jgi:hypothetical protein